MRTHALAILLGVMTLAGTGQAGKDKAGDVGKLDMALRKTAAMKNYAFQIDERGGQGSGGAFKGKYEQGKPVFFMADKIEFFKQGEALAYKQGEAWERSRTGRLSDPLRILGAAAKVRGARLPHEELVELAKSVKKVGLAKGEDSTFYVGDLEQAAARRLVPKALEGVAKEGQARIWVGPDGQVNKYAITIHVQGRQGNAEIDGQVARTVLLSDRGTAKVDVPAGAKKALEK